MSVLRLNQVGKLIITDIKMLCQNIFVGLDSHENLLYETKQIIVNEPIEYTVAWSLGK